MERPACGQALAAEEHESTGTGWQMESGKASANGGYTLRRSSPARGNAGGLK